MGTDFPPQEARGEGRVGSRIEGGRVRCRRATWSPTLEQPNIEITAPTATERTRTGGRWSEPFLKAAVADHRSFPDGSRIARLAFSLFFFACCIDARETGRIEVEGLRLGDLVNEIRNKPLPYHPKEPLAEDSRWHSFNLHFNCSTLHYLAMILMGFR